VVVVDRELALAIVEAALDRLRASRLLDNNVGIGSPCSSRRSTPSPTMRRAGGGAIVNVSSSQILRRNATALVHLREAAENDDDLFMCPVVSTSCGAGCVTAALIDRWPS